MAVLPNLSGRDPEGQEAVSLALLVIGNGRLGYLHQAVKAALHNVPHIDHYLMVDDSGSGEIAEQLDHVYPQFTITHHRENQGMARAVQAGFDLVLATDATHVLWVEEDMVIRVPLPVQSAITELDQNPHVAQMLFQRQPLTEGEIEGGSVLAGMGYTTDRGDWSEQRHIFSLNPCLVPRSILQHGWPAGNEREMTTRLLDRGYTFGVWHGERVEHIGVERAQQWQL